MSGDDNAYADVNRDIQRNQIMEAKPLPFADYPAAHSMDTTWFAVDENGEIGKFRTGGCGSAPLLEGMDPPTLEDKTRSNYTKAYDYDEQYTAVDEHFRAQIEDGDLLCQEDLDAVMPVHLYNVHDETNSLYYWDHSPEQAARIEDLPERLQNGRHLLFLKDYDFRSREPIDPYEYVARCYADWNRLNFKNIYPESYDQTLFPILNADGTWSIEAFEECDDAYGTFNGRAFFALDEDGCLALFRTDRFGAMPLEKAASLPKAEMPGGGRDDMNLWSELIHDVQLKKKHPELAAQKEKAEQAWREEGPRHWLEYPFGAASPRLFGMYHYDASWHHPMPYLRIGVPREALRFDSLSGELRGQMNPVHLPGIRFAEAMRVQPFELMPCFAASADSYDESFGWKYPQVWIDAALEHVHRCHEFAVFPGSEALLLRRARRHCRRIASLARP